MKKTITFLAFILFTSIVFSQIDGINYQAVIIDNNANEIPGVDVETSNLPNTALNVRFTINGDSGIEYQEMHATSTDDFGMINLMIGQGSLTADSPSSFNQIYWDGSKNLQVEIDFNNGDGFIVFSNQELTYIPYVRHREIIATSTLDVDGATNLNNILIVDGETSLNDTLEVDGTTNLNSNLTVLNQSPTLLTGDLTVEGIVSFDGGLDVGGDTQLYADLTVDGTTNLNGDLYVNNGATTNLSGDLIVQGQSTFDDGVFENLTVNQTTDLNGTLSVDGIATLNNTLNVNSASNLNGQVTVDANMGLGSDLNPAFYPLRVRGSRQGIHIRLTGNSGGSPNNSNNFVSFSGANNTRYGRIEGETSGEHASTFLFIWNASNVALETAFQAAMVFFDLLGIDDFDVAAVEGFEMVNVIANWEAVNVYNLANVGVSFSSGFGDYAEWLEKESNSEMFSYGDIVGVVGGKVSKDTKNANHYMVISQNPIVLGNMQQENCEKDFEKVAFMGQVPVKVMGRVNIGDYIVPSGLNDGIGRAISPKKLNVSDYEKIVGVAWSESKSNGMSLINLAVGINANNTSEMLQNQQNEINLLKKELNNIITYLGSKDKSFKAENFVVDNSSKVSNRIIETNTSTNSKTIESRSKAVISSQSIIGVKRSVSNPNKYSQILQLIEDNPQTINDIMADAREFLKIRNIDYKSFEQTNRLLTDKNYLLNHLRQLSK